MSRNRPSLRRHERRAGDRDVGVVDRVARPDHALRHRVQLAAVVRLVGAVSTWVVLPVPEIAPNGKPRHRRPPRVCSTSRNADEPGAGQRRVLQADGAFVRRRGGPHDGIDRGGVGSPGPAPAADDGLGDGDRALVEHVDPGRPDRVGHDRRARSDASCWSSGRGCRTAAGCRPDRAAAVRRPPTRRTERPRRAVRTTRHRSRGRASGGRGAGRAGGNRGE